jgi:hypothetical protein
MVAFHEEVGLFPKIAGENLLRNKILKFLEADKAMSPRSVAIFAVELFCEQPRAERACFE